MPLDSLSFVCLFLPLGLIVYYLVPKNARNLTLLGLGLVFYLLNDPWNLPLMLLSLGTDYMFYRLYCHYRQRVFLTGVTVKNAGFLLLAVWFVLSRRQALPLGILIYTFSSMDLFAGLSREELPDILSPVDFFLWHTLFFRLYAGPLVTPSVFYRQITARTLSVQKLLQGIYSMVEGLAVKLLVVDPLYALIRQLTPVPTFQLSFFGAWLTLTARMLYLLCLLEAYCRMARGIGSMFGFRLPHNIFFPLLSDSITHFLGRFNMSFTSLIRRRYWLPLQRRFPGRAMELFLLLTGGGVLGLYFSPDGCHFVWGLVMGLFLFLERRMRSSRVPHIPLFFRRCITCILIIFSFTMLVTTTWNDCLGLWHALFFGNNVLLNKQLLYLLSQYYVPLILAILLCSGGMFRIAALCTHRFPKSTEAAEGIFHLLLAVLSLTYLL